MPGRYRTRARREQEAQEKALERHRNRIYFRSYDPPVLDDVHQQRSKVRHDMRYLARYYFKGTDGQPYELEEYHLEILDEMFRGGYLVVNVPTDHMKSSLGCFLFPLFSLMENPDECHVICGANIRDSQRRIQAIEREIETNTLLTTDWPWVAKPEDRQSRIWTATQFNVAGRTINKPNPSVLASAIGANDLKGRRGKLIMDDCEGEDAKWSPTKRMQLESWLQLEARRCYEDKAESDRPLLCLMGTPFDVDSIYFKMEQQGWRVIRYPCYLDGGLEPDDPQLDTYGQPLVNKRVYLWPRKAEKVEEARHNMPRLDFSVSYLMDPTGGDPTRISEKQIRERVAQAKPIEADYTSGFICLDPATGGTGRKLDYAGVAAVRIHWLPGNTLPQVEVLECYDFRQGLFEQVNFCTELSQRHGFPVLVEGSGQQGGTYRNTFMHLHPQIRLLLYWTTRPSKFDDQMGLTVIKRLVIEKMLYVPPDRMGSEGMRAFVTEIRDLIPPFNQHNHISMAIWFAVRWVYERAIRHHLAPPIKLTYATNPLQALTYEDDTSLPPLERAYRAIGYDRTARTGGPQIIGYTAWRQQREMPWEKARREEEERFQEAVRKRRTG